MTEDPEAAEARARLRTLTRRLRTRSGRGAPERYAGAVRRLAAGLAAIGAPGHDVPDLPAHAWADLVTVLAGDALDDDRHAADVRRLLDEALEATRQLS